VAERQPIASQGVAYYDGVQEPDMRLSEWPNDELHERLRGLIVAIAASKGDAPGVAGRLATVQPKGVLGIRVERRASWKPEGPWIVGAVLGRWMFQQGQFSAVSEFGETVTYDRISSPFPLFKYCVVSPQLLAINCVFGPLASRGLCCRPEDFHGYRGFSLAGDRVWVA